MMEIHLVGRRGEGSVALVDECDYDDLAEYRWYLNASHRFRGEQQAVYAQRSGGPGRTVLMHRQIMGLDRGNTQQVDHVNGDGLDNRRINLRIATPQENVRNGPIRVDNTSGYRGVSFHPQKVGKARPWWARLRENGRTVSLDLHATPEAAARVYNVAARERWGEFARLNDVPETS